MANTAPAHNWPQVKGIISDLDGVVYRGNAAIPDAIQTFGAWQTAGLPFCFVTNNSTHTPEDVSANLRVSGLSSRRKTLSRAPSLPPSSFARHTRMQRAYSSWARHRW
ncbi:hypothetical protein [Bradyrhizobium guangdongense]|uniref:hypothetical protein n=1 Tax=Bradyrhizobium guangdongense TaxID=1325090 RepID=UPI003D317C07